MDIEILGTLPEYGLITNLGNISGTAADGILLAGSSRVPWLLGEPSARVPRRPLQERRPSYFLWHYDGLNHLRTKDTGTGVTPCPLHSPILPRIYSLRRRRRGAGLKGLLKAMGITGGSK